MKRVLCILSNMNAGGAETFLMKLYRTLDKDQYQMDFCVNVLEKNYYEDEQIKFDIVVTGIENLCNSHSINRFCNNFDVKLVVSPGNVFGEIGTAGINYLLTNEFGSASFMIKNKEEEICILRKQ